MLELAAVCKVLILALALKNGSSRRLGESFQDLACSFLGGAGCPGLAAWKLVAMRKVQHDTRRSQVGTRKLKSGRHLKLLCANGG